MSELKFESFKVEKSTFESKSGEVLEFFKISTQLNGATIHFRPYQKHASILKYAYELGMLNKDVKLVAIPRTFTNDKNIQCEYYDFLLTDTKKLSIKLLLKEDDKALFKIVKDGTLNYKL